MQLGAQGSGLSWDCALSLLQGPSRALLMSRPSSWKGQLSWALQLILETSPPSLHSAVLGREFLSLGEEDWPLPLWDLPQPLLTSTLHIYREEWGCWWGWRGHTQAGKGDTALPPSGTCKAQERWLCICSLMSSSTWTPHIVVQGTGIHPAQGPRSSPWGCYPAVRLWLPESLAAAIMVGFEKDPPTGSHWWSHIPEVHNSKTPFAKPLHDGKLCVEIFVPFDDPSIHLLSDAFPCRAVTRHERTQVWMLSSWPNCVPSWESMFSSRKWRFLSFPHIFLQGCGWNHWR